jgi:tetratricopeptide (TPR) repeat protein
MGRSRDCLPGRLSNAFFAVSAQVALVALVALAALFPAGGRSAEPPDHGQALEALSRPDAPARLRGVARLGEIGAMEDIPVLIERLRDSDGLVRMHAQDAMWQIWSRSGDAEVDALFRQGVGQMHAGELQEALSTFDRIVLRKPDFAEGWNKRATIRFLLGDYENSLMDCDEVFSRNPNHFGALAGAGQIHLMLGRPEFALDFFRRALEVNPNLDGPARMKELLEQYLHEEEVERRRHAT